MESRRHRILFFAEAVTLAHVARANVLARCLDPARFEVHASWDPRFNALLGPLPFVFHPIHSLPSELFLRRLSRGVPMHDVRTLRAYVDEDLATIHSVSPDVVVSDFRLSLVASARVAGVPLITVANAYWSPYARQTFVFPEYDYPMSRLVGGTIAQSLFQIFRPLGFAAHTRPLNTVLREHQLPGIGGDIRTMYTFGDYTAYADIPGLVPTFGAPPTHSCVGAVLWTPAVAQPPWWQELPSDRPVVYATPGSSGDGGMLPVVLDALAELPVTVIAATAARGRITRIPGNARIADFLSGTEAAARSALVICNGGSPTTSQALAAGVPVLALVSNNMDQHLNMEAVRRAGAGEALRARGVSRRAIRDLVERMLTTVAYTDRARILADSHRGHPAAIHFPALIERAVRA